MTAPLTKKEKILRMRRRGATYARIQLRLDTSEAYIYKVLREAGMVRERLLTRVKVKRAMARLSRQRNRR
jgi:transcriptional regulator